MINMINSKWKRIFRFQEVKLGKRNNIMSRNLPITLKFINRRVNIHTGNKFIKVFITPEKVGFKFGEFAFTRKHNKKKVKNEKFIKKSNPKK